MKVIKCGNWKIEVDIDKTKKYYNNFVKEDSQAYRNFVENLKTLNKEYEFFDGFGISADCCTNMSNVVYDDGGSPYGGSYFVCGRYLERPDEHPISADEASENYVDERIYIGMLRFDFQREDSLIKHIPDNLLEGFICINFWWEDAKWLLNEEPENSWDNISKKITEESVIKFANFKKDLMKFFELHNIRFTELSKGQIEEYRTRWLREYASQNVDFSKIKADCGFRLWHIFSFDYAPDYLQHHAAEQAFDIISKDKCILITNEFDNFAFEIHNGDALNSKVLRDISGYYDLTVSSCDFSWTYSKTHEEEMNIGPYFYKK